VNYDCDERLHSALGYIAPKDELEGRANAIKRESVEGSNDRRRTERKP